MNRLLIALLSVVSAGIIVSAGQTPAPAAQAAPAPTGTQVPTIELGFWRWRNLAIKELPR